jgi:hypothetical protein
MQFQHHRHSGRCRHGKSGEFGCAMCKKSALSEKTVWHSIAFVRNLNPEDVDMPDLRNHSPVAKYDIFDNIVIDAPPPFEPPDGQPLPHPDTRIICLTLRRLSEDDQYMVEYHFATSAVTMGNTSNNKMGAL